MEIVERKHFSFPATDFFLKVQLKFCIRLQNEMRLLKA